MLTEGLRLSASSPAAPVMFFMKQASVSPQRSDYIITLSPGFDGSGDGVSSVLSL